ncbi:hypothetical protein EJP82_26650 [Paenibacillus anaericanus]|uniref:Uncharacterized protein n=1 Tax=Paenibacillus anaericanus TaxID=170367 RepID=A0A433XVW3_9BACL|nr:hypothetical protein [Paenibacillus anaericanus]RUT38696.1 hypothetical protein EJP82_26650 [Paenibacillus anaericanus]
MKSFEEINAVIENENFIASQERRRWISILSEVFESEFPEIISKDYISHCIERDIRQGESKTVIDIKRYSSSGNLERAFGFNRALEKCCFKYHWFGRHLKQNKFKDTNIEKILDALTYSDKTPNIDSCVSEVIQESLALKSLIEHCISVGYKAWVQPAEHTPEIYQLVITWE